MAWPTVKQKADENYLTPVMVQEDSQGQHLRPDDALQLAHLR